MKITLHIPEGETFVRVATGSLKRMPEGSEVAVASGSNGQFSASQIAMLYQCIAKNEAANIARHEA